MADEQQYLAMLLDAPMQSWGHMSRFDRRMSLSYPTRSGVIGLLCAALGIDRGDTAGLAAFNDLKMTVFVFQQGGRMIDYHTVGGGWRRETHSQNIVPKADGSVKEEAVVTHREYLEDCKFGITLQDELGRLAEIAEALKNPPMGRLAGAQGVYSCAAGLSRRARLVGGGAGPYGGSPKH